MQLIAVLLQFLRLVLCHRVALVITLLPLRQGCAHACTEVHRMTPCLREVERDGAGKGAGEIMD